MTIEDVSKGSALLSIDGLVVAYGKAVVVREVRLHVRSGEFVVLLGRNGAGKTSILHAIAGLIPKATREMRFNGVDVSEFNARRIVRAGIVTVLERHRVFTELSVEDNLIVGLRTAGYGHVAARREMEAVYQVFPELEKMKHLAAARLSGGQQQILAVARGVAVHPKLLILDEPSIGLAPLIVDRILRVAKTLTKSGMAVLLVEQLVDESLRYADQCYILEAGEIVGKGKPTDSGLRKKIQDVYLGRETDSI